MAKLDDYPLLPFQVVPRASPKKVRLWLRGWCQTQANGFRKPPIRRTSGHTKFAPLGEGGGAIELEILAAVEVAFLIEVVVN